MFTGDLDAVWRWPQRERDVVYNRQFHRQNGKHYGDRVT